MAWLLVHGDVGCLTSKCDWLYQYCWIICSRTD
jgi:hypothetical protein